MKERTVNGFILYRGPSVIDNQPIICIATGLEDGGSNSKTGPMVQIYIMLDGIHPMQAVQTGADISICGNCRHRGKVITDHKTGLLTNVGRSCYVTLMHGPRVVYDGYQRGIYPVVTPAKARKLLARKRCRVGTYGDPAAVPVQIWQVALQLVDELTGYTHMWREYPALADFCMASCDSEAERIMAKALGFRTYRVRPEGEPKAKGEGHCPAGAEMGKAIQCAYCLLCGGHRSGGKADITIEVHGARKSNFNKELADA
jgi:hypothetical protein